MVRTHESLVAKWAENTVVGDDGFRASEAEAVVPALGATEVKIVTPRETPTAWWIGHHVVEERQPGVSARRGLSVAELLSHLG
ncbi:hypothetical protein K7472_19410 [Streptomyces sp. PTM05]|uniref:Uncharacterized protein n=1 Tax=Streptantibioticus parmotrematis TaxID=2873249 RepID=A0ABS7QUW7_9ACTN|nr:hypothetical protein [Streptantibioticus parmotrematis]MBY8887003.1 hypothetical protein [Streptantibioticus parmotrematis]